MLGWDVGTFEFTSERILALDYTHHVKLKLRTGGSTGKLGRKQCKKLPEGDGLYWAIPKREGKTAVRLPVLYRYRSPVVIEFYTARHRHPDACAVIWLQHLVDEEDTPINIPIWKTENYARLTQNYVTEENLSSMPWKDEVTEIGRLHFRARFKAGMDEAHGKFVTDEDSRETFETWEACKAEGVRSRQVDKELPARIQQLHEKSLVEGRDMLKEAGAEEQEKWLSNGGPQYSGTFGEDPADHIGQDGSKVEDEDSESDSDSDLGVRSYQGDNDTADGTASRPGNGENDDEHKKALERKHRVS